MNGAWFAGWGYMRFWEPRRLRAATHDGLEPCGDGDEAGTVSYLAPARPHTTEERRLQEITKSG